MSKVTKNERISTLEDAVAMNWSDMKKIETKISRAMTDMATRISNISLQLEGQQRQIHLAADSIGLNKQAIIMLENKAEPEPQLKQLDQSVFDGLDEKWRFAAVDGERGIVTVFDLRPIPSSWHNYHTNTAEGRYKDLCELTGYDTSNWQNSLIERDTAKELLEVDLSGELTGSELCKAMLARGDKYVMCQCWCSSYADIEQVMDIVSGFAFEEGKKAFAGVSHNWDYAVPINNQGEPLTASEVGL